MIKFKQLEFKFLGNSVTLLLSLIDGFMGLKESTQHFYLMKDSF